MPHASEKLFDLTGLLPGDVAEDAAPLLIRMHPEDVAPFLESAEASAKTMQPWRTEFRVDHPDKGELWIEWLGAPEQGRDVSMRWQGFMHDISERKRLEAELRAQSETQATLLRALSEVGLQQMVIESGRIIHVGHRALAHEFGFTDEMIEAQPPLESIIHPDDRARVMDYHRRRLAGDPVPDTYDLGLITLTGERREFEIAVAMVPDSQPPRLVSIGKDITERKQAEHLLKQRTREFRILTENLPEPIIRYDLDGRRRYVNPAYEKFFGIPAEDALGKSVTELSSLADAEEYQAHLQAAARGEQRDFEVITNIAHGPRTYRMHLVPERDDGGTVTGVLAIGHDLTDIHRMQETIATRERELRALADSSPGMMGSFHRRPDGSVYMPYVSPNIFDLFGLRPDEVAEDASPLFAMNHPEDAQRVIDSIAESARTMAAWHCEYRIIHPAKGERWMEGHSNPMPHADGGVIWYGQVHDITERKRLEIALARSEQAFRNLAENTPDTIARYDRDCRRIYINPAFLQLAGQSAEAMLGMTPTHHTDTPRTQAYEHALRHALASGENGSHELVWNGRDGQEFTSLISITPERDSEDHVTSVLAIGRDISERKRMETALQAREKEFRTLTENLPVAVIRYDLEQRRRYLNPAAERMLHGSAAELLGHVPGGPTVPATSAMLAHYRAEMAETLASGRMRELEFVLDALPVEQREHYEVRFVPEYDEDGRPCSVLAIWYEVTERERMEAELRQREREFRSLAENLPDVIVRFDSDCRRSYISPLYERFSGYPAEAMTGKSPAEHWPLPDGPAGGRAFQAHLRHVLDSGRPGKYELSWTRPDGKTAHMELRNIPECDSEGRVTGVLSIARDFSTQREMEEELRMAASVFEAAREGIAITDPSGCILDVNPAFTRISGYTRDEVLGKRPSLLSSGQHDKAFYQSMWSTLRAVGAWTGEVINRRKSGELYTEHLDIVAVHGETGAVKHYIGIFSDITLLKQHEQHLRHIAHHDTLTGLPNRMLLLDRMTQAIAHARRNGHMLAILFIDLDGFKPINDNHGHAMGDRVLVEIAGRMLETIRAGDTVARLGGDEFVVLLGGLTDTRESEFAASRLLEAINKPIALEGQRLNLSASIGISMFPSDDNVPEILLRYADQAMYFAKAAGRNQYLFHESDAREKTRADSQLVHDLRRALERNEISVHYQPIVDLASGQVVKAEALARWTHPERGPISPAIFIPIAESAGLIHSIGDRVFTQAARLAREWNKKVGPREGGPLRISINRSPRQFFSRDGAYGWVHHLIDQGISGEMLALEITEGLLLDDRPDVLKQLNQLRAMGMSISLDDFGTGYSALSYLKKFAIDVLKIDRSFIRDIAHDPSDRAIVESIILMAKRLGIKLIAEGVETREQVELLAAVGCDMVQGYYFARPMPEDEFLAFVLTRS
ncbi:MAG: PAS domain S-box protein [Pseudomonadota bacterium]